MHLMEEIKGHLIKYLGKFKPGRFVAPRGGDIYFEDDSYLRMRAEKSAFFHRTDTARWKIYISEITDGAYEDLSDALVISFTADAARSRFDFDLPQMDLDVVGDEVRNVKVSQPLRTATVNRENAPEALEATKLNDNSKEYLGSIAYSLQDAQDLAMRLPETGVSVIQGVPGSGKTNILFHRYQYLTAEKGIDPASIAFFCLHPQLADYLSTTARNMGLSVRALDIRSRIHAIATAACPDGADQDVRRSVSESQTRVAYLRTVCSKITNTVESVFSAEFFGLIGQAQGLSEQGRELVAGLRARMSVRGPLQVLQFVKNEIWEGKTYTKDEISQQVKLSRLKEFEELAQESVKKAWKNAWLRVCGRPWNRKPSFSRLSLRKFLDTIAVEDLAYLGIFFAKKYLPSKGKMKMDDFVGEFSALQHVLLDEAQDFNPLEFDILRLWCSEEGGFTLAGDLAQSIMEGGVATWNQLVGEDIDKRSVITLDLTLRTTGEIMRFASMMMVEDRHEPPAVQFARSGKKPLVSFGVDLGDVLQRIGDGIIADRRELSAARRVAVICDNLSSQAIEALQHRLMREGIAVGMGRTGHGTVSGEVIIADYEWVKGLEFDTVHCVFPDQVKSENGHVAHLLYVAFTRARNQLQVHLQNGSVFLEKFSSDSYDLN